jgi:hypothetical protein
MHDGFIGLARACLVRSQKNAGTHIIGKTLQLVLEDFAFAAAQALSVGYAAYFFQ